MALLAADGDPNGRQVLETLDDKEISDPGVHDLGKSSGIGSDKPNLCPKTHVMEPLPSGDLTVRFE